jgi:SlyX protein
MSDTSRLDDLEIRIAHQDAAIESLNETITSQWKEIDRLKREIERLGDRVASAEASMPGDAQDEPPPPHW